MGAIIEGQYWDYGPNDTIDCFDIEKSYFLTKYRPINDKEGLDFNPDWFREDAIRKQSTGRYSNTIYGTRKYKEFWDERMRRCIEGYEVNGYKITGDNYFFLNFYNLKTSEIDTINQTYGFPSFLVFQYEYFHYIEMCQLLGKDVAVLKSRGLGFSEMASAIAVNHYTMIPNYRILVTAYSKKHLDPTLLKLWYQLDWLNENTEGALKRVRMVINTNTHKRASKKTKDSAEIGRMSEIQGIIVDEPDKLRGDRVQMLIYEEAGADPELSRKWTKGEALITVLGGKRVGMRIAFGTGGSSKAGSMEGLKNMITSPESFNLLPVKHNFTADGSYKTTGMFIPAYRIVYSLIDNRGYCNRDKAIEWYNKEREKKALDPKEFMNYKTEFCFTIEEALLQKEDNMFPREELTEQLTALDIYKTIDPPKRGYLIWETYKDGENRGERTGKVLWREDPNGNIYIAEHPLLGDSGAGFNNLYVGGIDSIDIGSKDSATLEQSKLSDFCILIKKRVFGLNPPQYVAMYKDRPKDPREAYENAAKLLTYYNGAKAVLESTRTALLTYFRDKKYMYMLMKRPRATLSDVSKSNSNMYGAPSNEKTINHGRELVYDFCLDYANTITFREMLEQLLGYSDERKREFDIVAAMIMAELADEELSSKVPVERQEVAKNFRDFGWWTDSNGYRHYGVIPKTDWEKDANRRIREYDSWLYKDFI